MKKQLFTMGLILFSAFSALAATDAEKLHCTSAATKAAEQYMRAEEIEFATEYSIVWACKLKSNPNKEEINFGDGHGIVGVVVNIENNQCVVKDIYSGQDDQDSDDTWDAENCLHNVR